VDCGRISPVTEVLACWGLSFALVFVALFPVLRVCSELVSVGMCLIESVFGSHWNFVRLGSVTLWLPFIQVLWRVNYFSPRSRGYSHLIPVSGAGRFS